MINSFLFGKRSLHSTNFKMYSYLGVIEQIQHAIERGQQ